MTQRLVLALALLLPAAASAQITWDGCRDAQGVSVASVPDESISDVAMAGMAGTTPVIRYNRFVLGQLGETSRLFWYLHECGHHALGQIRRGVYLGLADERAADCWAAAKLRELRALTPQALARLAVEFAPNPGDWAHLPGPYRVLDIASCGGPVGQPGTRDLGPRARQIPCTHPVRCVHHIPCQHPVSQCGCAHPADSTPWGPGPCQHCGCTTTSAHPFDTAHFSDSVHAFDEVED